MTPTRQSEARRPALDGTTGQVCAVLSDDTSLAAACQFLDRLFDDAIGDDARLSIWSLPSKLSSYHTTVESAATEAVRLNASGADVYFGVGLRRTGLTANQRGTAADVVAITCLWADVDIGEHESKKPHPPDLDAALAWLDDLPTTPSVVVNSGHGLHAYWLLSEPVVNNAEAAHAAKAWGRYLQAHARERHGWAFDSTWDIARVLRVPKTTNRKYPDDPVTVRVLTDLDNPTRHHVHDLLAHVDGVDTMPEAKCHASDNGRLQLRPDAQPPADKLAALIANDPKFATTYNGTRDNLTDPSPSGYDLSLADTCVAAKWSDQEVADLLIARRRDRNEKPAKALRPDYIGTVLAKARESTAVDDDLDDALDDLVAETDINTTTDADETTATKVCTALRKALGLDIQKLVKIGGECASYDLHLTDGRVIRLGTASELLNFARVQASVFDRVGIVIPQLPKAKWLNAVKLLGRITETVDGDVTYNWHTTRLLENYVKQHGIGSDSDDPGLNMSDKQAVVRTICEDGLSFGGPSRRPPFHDTTGRIYIAVEDFCGFIRQSGELVTAAGLIQRLRRLDFQGTRVRVRQGETVFQSRRFVSPPGVVKKLVSGE